MIRLTERQNGRLITLFNSVAKTQNGQKLSISDVTLVDTNTLYFVQHRVGDYDRRKENQQPMIDQYQRQKSLIEQQLWGLGVREIDIKNQRSQLRIYEVKKLRKLIAEQKSIDEERAALTGEISQIESKIELLVPAKVEKYSYDFWVVECIYKMDEGLTEFYSLPGNSSIIERQEAFKFIKSQGIPNGVVEVNMPIMEAIFEVSVRDRKARIEAINESLDKNHDGKRKLFLDPILTVPKVKLVNTTIEELLVLR